MFKLKLNENLKERRMGFIFMFVFFLISLFYLFYGGWLYEWVEYGFAGASQHWDWKVFNDMSYEIIDGEYVYYSTHNLMHFLYLCYWSAYVCFFYLITGNKWLRQGAIATMAFPVMTLFSTINPVNVQDIFSSDVFLFHSYYLQFVFDMNHVAGIIMGFYIFYTAVRDKVELNLKMMAPFILGTWVIYILTKAIMTDGLFWVVLNGWVPSGVGGYYDTNQINMFPFHFYGLEYLLVVFLLFGINFGVKLLTRKISNPKWQAIIPYGLFAGLTIIMVLMGLIELQNIPWQAFIQ